MVAAQLMAQCSAGHCVDDGTAVCSIQFHLCGGTGYSGTTPTLQLHAQLLYNLQGLLMRLPHVQPPAVLLSTAVSTGEQVQACCMRCLWRMQ